MRLTRLLQVACCGSLLIAISTQAFAEEEAENQDKEKTPPAPVLIEKPPVYEPPTLKPLKPLTPAPLLVRDKQEKKADQDKQKPKDQPARKQAQARPPLHRPGPRSRITAFQIENLSRGVHLSPAMRWHLNRSGIATDSLPGTSPQQANHGEPRFYPGVSRLPEQKPFEGLQPAPTAFDRYWPLLLEGQQNPNTGFIIWRFP